jgi:magnesium transporter
VTQPKELREVQQHISLGQFAQAAEELSRLQATDQSDLLETLSEGQAAEVFRFLDPAYQARVLEELSPPRVLRLVETLDPDDRARLLEEIPAEVARRLLSGLTLSAELMGYPPESAGRYMTPEFLALAPGMTAGEALAEIRRKGRTAETIYTLPVVQPDGIVFGVVHLRELVMADPDRRVKDLVDPGIEAVLATEDRERAARLIQTTDALAVPVTDARGRLVGLVTADDAMDILDEEGAEDLARAGGASEPLDRPYFSVSILQLARARVVWLLALAVAATLTVNVLNVFEDTLATVVTLALFIPLLIGTGGNAGAQSATTLVRAMSVGEVESGDLSRIVLREAAAGALLGTMLAAVGFLPVWLFAGGRIATVIALTLIGICAWASLIGAVVPLTARRLGIDPAVASAPFITTLIDATGLILYFLIAHAVLF